MSLFQGIKTYNKRGWGVERLEQKIVRGRKGNKVGVTNKNDILNNMVDKEDRLYKEGGNRNVVVKMKTQSRVFSKRIRK